MHTYAYIPGLCHLPSDPSRGIVFFNEVILFIITYIEVLNYLPYCSITSLAANFINVAIINKFQ